MGAAGAGKRSYTDLERRLRTLPLLRVRVQLARDPRHPPSRLPWADEDEREVAALERALAAWTDEERELVRLRYFERRTWPEVAAALAVSPSTALRCRRRLLGRLAEALGAS